MANMYFCSEYKGGGAGALDSLLIATLQHGDCAIVVSGVSGIASIFRFDSSGVTAENTTTHPFDVRPDDYSVAGVWDEKLISKNTET